MIPYRDDNPTQGWSFITFFFIVGNIAVFVWSLTQPDYNATLCYWGAVAADLTSSVPPLKAVDPCRGPQAPTLYTVLAHMFFHGGFLHLAGNMLYLWIFGNNIEDILGHGRFIVFYVLCGLAALLAQVLAQPDAAVPMVGASGAIAGVLGAYMILFPLARISMFVPIFIFLTSVQVPAFFMLFLWFIMQVVSGMFEPATAGGGVAWWAHIGGFIAGVVLILFFPKKRKPRKRWSW